MAIGFMSSLMVMSGYHARLGLNGVPTTTADGFGSPHVVGPGFLTNRGDGSHTTMAAGTGEWVLGGIGSPQLFGAPAGSAGTGDKIIAVGLP